MSLDNLFKKGLAYIELRHEDGFPTRKVLMHNKGVYTLEDGTMDSLHVHPGSQVELPERAFGYSLSEVLHEAQKLKMRTNAPVVIKPMDADHISATKPKHVYKGPITLVALDGVEKSLTSDLFNEEVA